MFPGETQIFLALGAWTSVLSQHYWNTLAVLEELYFVRPASSAFVLIRHFSCKRTMWPHALPDKALKHTDLIFEVRLWEAPISEQVTWHMITSAKFNWGSFGFSYRKVFLTGILQNLGAGQGRVKSLCPYKAHQINRKTLHCYQFLLHHELLEGSELGLANSWQLSPSQHCIDTKVLQCISHEKS